MHVNIKSPNCPIAEIVTFKKKHFFGSRRKHHNSQNFDWLLTISVICANHIKAACNWWAWISLRAWVDRLFKFTHVVLQCQNLTTLLILKFVISQSVLCTYGSSSIAVASSCFQLWNRRCILHKAITRRWKLRPQHFHLALIINLKWSLWTARRSRLSMSMGKIYFAFRRYTNIFSKIWCPGCILSTRSSSEWTFRAEIATWSKFVWCAA